MIVNPVITEDEVGNVNGVNVQESKLTVPWVSILGLVGALLGALFLTQINHEGRLVKTETLIPAIMDSQKAMDAKQDTMLGIINQIRQDQIRREKSGYPEYRGVHKSENR